MNERKKLNWAHIRVTEIAQVCHMKGHIRTYTTITATITTTNATHRKRSNNNCKCHLGALYFWRVNLLFILWKCPLGANVKSGNLLKIANHILHVPLPRPCQPVALSSLHGTHSNAHRMHTGRQV